VYSIALEPSSRREADDKTARRDIAHKTSGYEVMRNGLGNAKTIRVTKAILCGALKMIKPCTLLLSTKVNLRLGTGPRRNRCTMACF
jgi:hypothetical protein